MLNGTRKLVSFSSINLCEVITIIIETNAMPQHSTFLQSDTSNQS